MLFLINYQLCKEFPALSPYDVDDKTFHAVIKLYSEVRTMQMNEEGLRDRINNPNRVIRKPAGDDWF